MRTRTVRQRLRAFVVVGTMLVVVVGGAGLIAVEYVSDRSDQINELGRAQDAVEDVGRAADALRSNVDLAMFASQGIVTSTQPELLQTFSEQADLLDSALTDVQRVALPQPVEGLIHEMMGATPQFFSQSDRLSDLAFTDFEAATAALPAYHKLAADLGTKQQAVLSAIDTLTNDARLRSDEVPRQVAIGLVGMVIVTITLLGLCAFVLGRLFRRSLGTLGEVASSIARGDLRARATISSDDELGELAGAINAMATDLQVVVEQMEASAERDGFGSKLSEALEMADTEVDALRTIERAMTAIPPESPMEILLADSSKSHLGRAASNPTSSAPCCPVESPFSCVAVRRGNPVVFENSEHLNACPKLRDRPSGPISAVCVPVTFMGRALGVLHATGPVGSPLGPKAVGQLTSLATQSGGRIGTVRSFERSQLQATTDGLTGLRNRRTVETELRGMLGDGVQLSLVMADLDHFKLLNDTYGHEAGDRALRTFSRVLESSLRESDIAGRLGGEEFVIAMPNTPVSTAVEILDRLRERLTVADEETGNPTFTSSFGVVDSSLALNLDELLRIADAALYRAKDEGRNRVTVADERDVQTASRPGKPTVPVENPSRAVMGAFQRAAALDDPMSEALQRR